MALNVEDRNRRQASKIENAEDFGLGSKTSSMRCGQDAVGGKHDTYLISLIECRSCLYHHHQSTDVVFPDFVLGSLSSTAATTVGRKPSQQAALSNLRLWRAYIDNSPWSCLNVPTSSRRGHHEAKSVLPSVVEWDGDRGDGDQHDEDLDDFIDWEDKADDYLGQDGLSKDAITCLLLVFSHHSTSMSRGDEFVTFCSPAERRRRVSLQDGAATFWEDGDGLQEPPEVVMRDGWRRAARATMNSAKTTLPMHLPGKATQRLDFTAATRGRIASTKIHPGNRTGREAARHTRNDTQRTAWMAASSYQRPPPVTWMANTTTQTRWISPRGGQYPFWMTASARASRPQQLWRRKRVERTRGNRMVQLWSMVQKDDDAGLG
ncbi:hypothetical protein BDZ89DRAFT_1048064 [Hymenopellis radicata]|nr:hypothetical protein BDZ89DRAFT_1048064 [Hymenopellis radicata]